MHLGERDYTFHSNQHMAYSSIDYFLIPHRRHAIEATTIGSITWSDHAPISQRYAISDIHARHKSPWRLNESLLQDLETLEEMVAETRHYFDSNSTPDSDSGVVWEAHKAVIRGVLIKHGSRLKQRTAQLNQLLQKLQKLETDHKQTPIRLLGTELDTVRTQITDLLHFKAKAALQVCKRKVYEVR